MSKLKGFVIPDFQLWLMYMYNFLMDAVLCRVSVSLHVQLCLDGNLSTHFFYEVLLYLNFFLVWIVDLMKLQDRNFYCSNMAFIDPNFEFLTIFTGLFLLLPFMVFRRQSIFLYWLFLEYDHVVSSFSTSVWNLLLAPFWRAYDWITTQPTEKLMKGGKRPVT